MRKNRFLGVLLGLFLLIAMLLVSVMAAPSALANTYDGGNGHHRHDNQQGQQQQQQQQYYLKYVGGFAWNQTRWDGSSNTDLGTYCKWLGYEDQAKNDDNSQYGWYCYKYVHHILIKMFINFASACEWAFGPGLVSMPDGPGPNTQKCYQPIYYSNS